MTPFAFLPYRRRRITLGIARLWREAQAATKECYDFVFVTIAPSPSDFADHWTNPRNCWSRPQIGRRLASRARRRDIANDIGPEVFG